MKKVMLPYFYDDGNLYELIDNEKMEVLKLHINKIM